MLTFVLEFGWMKTLEFGSGLGLCFGFGGKWVFGLELELEWESG